MYKVVVDGFDNEEESVVFVHWLITQMNAGKVKLFTCDGLIEVSSDGVDTQLSTKYQKHLDITTWEPESDDDL